MGRKAPVSVPAGLTAAEKASLEALSEDPPTFKQRAVGRVLGILYHRHLDRERGAAAESLERQVGRSLFGATLPERKARDRGRMIVRVAVATGYVERTTPDEGSARYVLTAAGLDLAERATADAPADG